jgi:Amidase
MSDLNLDLCYMTATEAIAAFKTRALSPVELLKAIIARCEQLEPKVNALTYTYFDRALEQAKAAESQYTRRGGQPRPLEGVTVAIKDFHPVKGEITTFGSKIYRDYRPDSNGTDRPAVTGCGRDHALRDNHARICPCWHDGKSALGHHAQSVEFGLHTGRLFRRCGRCAGRRDDHAGRR